MVWPTFCGQNRFRQVSGIGGVLARQCVLTQVDGRPRAQQFLGCYEPPAFEDNCWDSVTAKAKVCLAGLTSGSLVGQPFQ